LNKKPSAKKVEKDLIFKEQGFAVRLPCCIEFWQLKCPPEEEGTIL